MPTGFTSQLRASRGPIVAIAAWLVVLQAFLAGVTIAQAAAMRAGLPFDAAICHGVGQDGAPLENKSSDPAGLRHPCCVLCAATSPATLSTAPAVASDAPPRAATRLVPRWVTVVIAHGAVRAGQSQAPPANA